MARFLLSFMMLFARRLSYEEIILEKSDAAYEKLKHHISEFKDKTPYFIVKYSEGGVQKECKLRFELFWDTTPRSSLNFAMLVKGFKPIARDENNNIIKDYRFYQYKGCKFHRMIKGFIIQSGDFTNGDGTGGVSIYGGNFRSEYLNHENKFGTLAMADRGKDTLGSQFYINMADNAFLNNRYLVFGKIKDGCYDSLEALKKLNDVPKYDGSEKPIEDVIIFEAGFEEYENQHDEEKLENKTNYFF